MFFATDPVADEDDATGQVNTDSATADEDETLMGKKEEPHVDEDHAARTPAWAQEVVPSSSDEAKAGR